MKCLAPQEGRQHYNMVQLALGSPKIVILMMLQCNWNSTETGATGIKEQTSEACLQGKGSGINYDALKFKTFPEPLGQCSDGNTVHETYQQSLLGGEIDVRLLVG